MICSFSVAESKTGTLQSNQIENWLILATVLRVCKVAQLIVLFTEASVAAVWCCAGWGGWCGWRPGCGRRCGWGWVASWVWFVISMAPLWIVAWSEIAWNMTLGKICSNLVPQSTFSGKSHQSVACFHSNPSTFPVPGLSFVPHWKSHQQCHIESKVVTE